MGNKESKEIWVVEWSEIQQSFHVDSVNLVLRNNCLAYFQKRQIQYYPVAFASSHEEAHKILKLLEEKRKEDNDDENITLDYLDGFLPQ